MSMSSGTRSVVMEAAGWGFAAVLVAFAIANFGSFAKLPGRSTTAGGDAAIESGTDAPQNKRGGAQVELEAGDNGHYRTEAEINGRPINLMVDTGASMVVLTFEDAEAAGIFLNDSDFTHQASTANGIARIAPVKLDRVSIGDITVRNVEAAVSEQGKLSQTLLGMSFLSRVAHVEMSGGKLRLSD
jgi:aspartyl protease family protein